MEGPQTNVLKRSLGGSKNIANEETLPSSPLVVKPDITRNLSSSALSKLNRMISSPLLSFSRTLNKKKDDAIENQDDEENQDENEDEDEDASLPSSPLVPRALEGLKKSQKSEFRKSLSSKLRMTPSFFGRPDLSPKGDYVSDEDAKNNKVSRHYLNAPDHNPDILKQSIHDIFKQNLGAITEELGDIYDDGAEVVGYVPCEDISTADLRNSAILHNSSGNIKTSGILRNHSAINLGSSINILKQAGSIPVIKTEAAATDELSNVELTPKIASVATSTKASSASSKPSSASTKPSSAVAPNVKFAAQPTHHYADAKSEDTEFKTALDTATVMEMIDLTEIGPEAVVKAKIKAKQESHVWYVNTKYNLLIVLELVMKAAAITTAFVSLTTCSRAMKLSSIRIIESIILVPLILSCLMPLLYSWRAKEHVLWWFTLADFLAHICVLVVNLYGMPNVTIVIFTSLMIVGEIYRVVGIDIKGGRKIPVNRRRLMICACFVNMLLYLIILLSETTSLIALNM